MTDTATEEDEPGLYVINLTNDRSEHVMAKKMYSDEDSVTFFCSDRPGWVCYLLHSVRRVDFFGGA